MSEQKKYSGPLRSLILFWVSVLVFVGFFVGVIIGVSISTHQRYSSTENGGYFDSSLYSEVEQLLHDNYLNAKKIDDKTLFYGALRGMVSAVGDPYTTFFDPQANKDFNEELSGSFDGIGAELGIKNNRLTVIAPLPDSPAERAGLRAGDAVVSINKKDASSMSLDEAVAEIRGKRGTSVQLTIYHMDSNDVKTISIQRATIVVPTVVVKYVGDIAVLSLYNFNAESEKQFVQKITEVKKHGVTGLVLDLRNNPGGFLDKAVSIASAWLDKGQNVVSEVSQDEHTTDAYPAIKQVAAPAVPLVILVNEGTASAAEILAGALQDYGKATLIGTKTYGKGSVQEVKDLPDGSAVKITISQWVTPKGRFINEVGITPDMVVPMTDADYAANKDPQLEKALGVVKAKAK